MMLTFCDPGRLKGPENQLHEPWRVRNCLLLRMFGLTAYILYLCDVRRSIHFRKRVRELEDCSSPNSVDTLRGSYGKGKAADA